MKYEIPHDLEPEEERAILAALERYFTQEHAPPSPWVLAGRASNVRLQPLHLRRDTTRPWQGAYRFPLAHRSTPNLHGRGDAR